MLNPTYDPRWLLMRTGLWQSIAAGLILGLAAQSLSGQTSQPRTSGKPPPAATKEDPRWDLVITNGELLRRGTDDKRVEATLRNVIDYLRELLPVNVVLAPGVGEIAVGDLKLAAFQWEPGLEALRVASGNAFTWRSHPERLSGVDPTTGLPIAATDAEPSDLLVLTADESAARRPTVEVFNLAGFVQQVGEDKAEEKLKEVMMIIHETLRELGEKKGIDYRYHSGALLLVVTGTPEKLEIAKRILLALPQVTPSRASDASATARSQDEAEQLRRRYGLPAGTQIPGIGSPSGRRPTSKF